jgi:GNAT superfamily N-acetyltransferase
MNDLVIRQAVRADLPGMLALYGQSGYDDGDVLDEPAAAAILAKAASYPFYRFYVGVSEDAIVGTFALLVMDNIGHRGTPSAIVESVAVDPARQGCGVGRRMMEHAIALAREQGCYKLALSSSAKRTRAHAFYEKLGFERHGVSFHVAIRGEENGG